MTVTPDKVHFVGSIALDSVEEVMREVGTTCGRRLRRVPDGEPGGRRLWISWQWPVLRASAYLREVAPQPEGRVGPPILEIAPGVDPKDITFGEIGYAREARASYQDFLAARDRRELPGDVKFQVALPTPFAVVSPFLVPESIQAVLPAYERAMFAEVQRIADAIPHEDLAVQWDVCIEMILWDGQPSIIPQFPGAREVVKQTLERCLDAVPADVEMGIHLCYGDWDAKHFIEPQDAGKEVELANTIAELADRPLAWMHMPVPIARTDDAFYGPLADLQLNRETELYLGLIHGDGKDAERIAAASKVVSDFGIATECGIARQRTPEQVRALIRAHAAASAEPVAGA
jgi:methionine synthase II (cobalamin-independent)